MQNITNTLPQQPVAKIIVDGLFILCINEEARTAQLGVYEYANEHNFFIRVSKKDHNSKSVLLNHGVLVRKLDEKHEIETGDISISASNRPADIVCYQHEAVTEKELKTDLQVDPNSQKDFENKGYTTDFRWVIDLEGNRFHDKKLDVVPGVIQRKIHLLNGVVYTESWVPRKIVPAYKMATKLAGGNDSHRFLYVANQTAFAIEKLIGEETIDISYVENDEPKTLSLPKTEPGVYYEILISNNCPDSVAEKKERQSDFQHYYNVVNVPVVERLELQIAPGTGSFRFPCDLTFLGQTPELP